MYFAEEEVCQWQWHGQHPGGAWEQLPGATSRRYWPTPDDAGCRLRVECTPARRAAANDGSSSSSPETDAAGLVLGAPLATECGPVEVPPSPPAAAGRHPLTAAPTASPQLRVVTYNILADQYAGTEVAQNVIFAHCPRECVGG